MARPSPSRRALLAGAAVLAVPVAASANSAVAPAFVNLANPDAPLIALAAEFCDLERQREAKPGPTTLKEERAYDAAVAPLQERQDKLVFDMLDLPPASTLAGHQAVALALAAYADPSDYGADHDTAEQLIGLLLAGLAGREQTAGRRVEPVDVEPVPLPSPSADRELLEVCAAVHAIDRTLSRPRLERPDEHPDPIAGDLRDWHGPVAEARKLIQRACDLPARTMMGQIAKAKVAALFSTRAEEWRLACWLHDNPAVRRLSMSLAEDMAGLTTGAAS